MIWPLLDDPPRFRSNGNNALDGEEFSAIILSPNGQPVDQPVLEMEESLNRFCWIVVRLPINVFRA